ncbi:MAG: PspC domain-containing protein [Cyclobacteriaceae bacterium]
MILGVSGWLGKKIGMKEKMVRIAFIVGFLLFGVGLVLYLVLWIVKLITK